MCFALVMMMGAFVAGAVPAIPDGPQIGDVEDEAVFDGFFCLGKDGVTRVGTTKAFVGPVQTCMSSTIVEQRLSPEEASRLAPLVCQIKSLERSPQPGFTLWRQGWGRDFGSMPNILVGFGMKKKLVDIQERPSRERNHVNERHYVWSVEKIRVFYALELTADWLDAWRQADAAITDFVKATLEPATPNKRHDLEEIVDCGIQALNTMARLEAGDRLAQIVKGIEPTATAQAMWQPSWREQWQNALEELAECLQIEPQMKWPEVVSMDRSSRIGAVLQWVSKATTREHFMERVHAENDNTLLQYPLRYFKIYGNEHGACRIVNRVSAIAMVPGMEEEAWQAVKSNVGCEMRMNAQCKKREKSQIFELMRRSRMSDAEEILGVRFGPADEDTLNDLLLFRGDLVETVTPQGRSLGIEIGDIIPSYYDYNDVLGKATRIENSRTWPVFRGRNVFIINLPNRVEPSPDRPQSDFFSQLRNILWPQGRRERVKLPSDS